MPTTSASTPALPELIKLYEQRVHDFCHYLLPNSSAVDELILNIFRAFGETYRKTLSRRRAVYDAAQVRITLFSLAWENAKRALETESFSWPSGRDTRNLKGWDENLICAWRSPSADTAAPETAVQDRLQRLDPEFRAVLILRDILQFEDEEIMQILTLRWGVYRLRLHRARMEFREALRGRADEVAPPERLRQAPAPGPVQHEG